MWGTAEGGSSMQCYIVSTSGEMEIARIKEPGVLQVFCSTAFLYL